MEVSSRGRYSLRVLVVMASGPPGHLFTIHELADAEAVSPAYVQQLMTLLRTAGFVTSHRGKLGGYHLARPSETVTVADILRTTEGQTAPAPCLGNERCDREAYCRTRPLWQKVETLLEDFFSGVSLADLARRGESGDPRVAAGA